MSAIPAARSSQASPLPEEPRAADLKLLVPTLGLISFGVAMVFSASIPFCAREESGHLFYYLWRELLFVGVGVLAMWGITHVPMDALRRSSRFWFVLTAALLAGLFPFGTMVNGSKCWYTIFGFSFQPSEMAKLALVICCAGLFARHPQGMHRWQLTLQPFAVLGLVAGLIVLEPDMGTAAVIVMAMFIFYHSAGMKLRHLAVAAFPGLLGAAYMIHTHPYQLERLRSFFFGGPEVELAGGYQKVRSLIALGSGGLTGRGYFQGIEKYFYLPEVTTDSILPVIGEELGFVATAVVTALFAALVWRGMVIARKAPDRFSGLVAAGVTCFFGVQALLNIAVATGSIPATGVTLPFVSYGGSSLLFSMIGVGLLLNVSRTITWPGRRRRPSLRVIG